MPTQLTNRIVDSVPRKNRAAFLGHCDTVELEFAQNLARPREKILHVYFPTTGFISLLATIAGGPQLEVGLVGNEGMLGASLLLGTETAPLHAIVQGAGSSLRMPTGAFRAQMHEHPKLERAVSRYLYVQLVQLAQAAGCTRFHLIQARLARWLLMTADRAHAERFHLTHVFLSSMLGVRRVGVTEAASALQARGLISYRRGEIIILDRDRLQEAACSCYLADIDAYEQVMA